MKRIGILSYLFLVLLILFGCFAFRSQYAFAQSAPVAQIYTPQAYLSDNLEPGTRVNSSTRVQNLVIDIIGSFDCLVAGYNASTPDHLCLTPNPLTGKLGYHNQSGNLLNGVAFLMTTTTLPPIHSTDFAQYASSNFGINHAYADTGFDSLSPLIGIWSAFRNAVYLLYILVFVIVGFAIMLRLKIDPRTVMTIQNQLPKIIINLILVTFSFAIAGLLIDFMWVVVYLIINLMHSIDPKILPATVTQHLYDNPIGFFNQIIDVKGTAGTVGRAFQQVIQGLITPQNFGGSPDIGSTGCTDGPGGLFCTLGQAKDKGFGAALGDLTQHVTGIFGFLVSWIIGILGMVIIAIAIIVAMVKLWWALIQSYVYVLINTIIAPFTIFGGLLPGSKAGFGSWLKSILANILVFPTTMSVLLLGKAIIDALNTTNGKALFLAPLIGDPNIISSAPGNADAGAATNPLGVIIGFAILLITPKIVDTVKQAVGAADFKAASGVFENVGAGQQFAGAAQKGLGTSLFKERDTIAGKRGGFLTEKLMTSRLGPRISQILGRRQYTNEAEFLKGRS